jgi:hypothetical protein
VCFEFFRFAPPRFVCDDGGTECARDRDGDFNRDDDRDRDRLSRLCRLVSTESSSFIASLMASSMLSGSCGGDFVKNLNNLVNNDCWGGGGDGDGDDLPR